MLKAFFAVQISLTIYHMFYLMAIFDLTPGVYATTSPLTYEFVSVCGDATYAILRASGPVCSGKYEQLAGVACPKKGDITDLACRPGLPSYNGVNCTAMEDAICDITSDGNWGCVFPSLGCPTTTHTVTHDPHDPNLRLKVRKIEVQSHFLDGSQGSLAQTTNTSTEADGSEGSAALTMSSSLETDGYKEDSILFASTGSSTPNSETGSINSDDRPDTKEHPATLLGSVSFDSSNEQEVGSKLMGDQVIVTSGSNQSKGNDLPSIPTTTQQTDLNQSVSIKKRPKSEKLLEPSKPSASPSSSTSPPAPTTTTRTIGKPSLPPTDIFDFSDSSDNSGSENGSQATSPSTTKFSLPEIDGENPWVPKIKMFAILAVAIAVTILLFIAITRRRKSKHNDNTTASQISRVV